jgi:hypothetical protein
MHNSFPMESMYDNNHWLDPTSSYMSLAEVALMDNIYYMIHTLFVYLVGYTNPPIYLWSWVSKTRPRLSWVFYVRLKSM